MASQANNAGNVRRDPTHTDDSQLTDNFITMRLQYNEDLEGDDHPQDHQAPNSGTDEQDIKSSQKSSELRPQQSTSTAMPDRHHHASPMVTQHGLSAPLSAHAMKSQPAPFQQSVAIPTQPSSNSFMYNGRYNMQAPQGYMPQVPQAYYHGPGILCYNNTQQFNQHGFSTQFQQPYNLPQTTYSAFNPARNQSNGFLDGPRFIPTGPSDRPLIAKAPTDEDIRGLGYEDAIILVDARRKNSPSSTSIKNILKEVWDELSAMSKSTKVQKNRIDRSVYPLSAEHNHICEQKRTVHSPTHVNTVWSQRDKFTLESMDKLSQISNKKLLRLLEKKAAFFLGQRNKKEQSCQDCETMRKRIPKDIASPGESSSPLEDKTPPVDTTKIMIGGLPAHANVYDVLVLFQEPGLPLSLSFDYGIIQDIKRLPHLPDVAFVTFHKRRHAEEAINKMQGYPLDAQGKIRLRLSWGRNQPKLKTKSS